MSVIAGASPAAVPGGAVRAVGLAIGGMTCASCAARVEKKLGKLDGVSATVNFATGTARVSFPAELSATDLVSVVAVLYAQHVASQQGDADPGAERALAAVWTPAERAEIKAYITAITFGNLVGNSADACLSRAAVPAIFTRRR
jgi:Cu+-exporting ATPase